MANDTSKFNLNIRYVWYMSLRGKINDCRNLGGEGAHCELCYPTIIMVGSIISEEVLFLDGKPIDIICLKNPLLLMPETY